MTTATIGEQIRQQLQEENFQAIAASYAEEKQLYERRHKGESISPQEVADMLRERAILTGRPLADLLDEWEPSYESFCERLKYRKIYAEAKARKKKLEAAYKAGEGARQRRDEAIKAAEDLFRKTQMDISAATSEVQEVEASRATLIRTCADLSLLARRKELMRVIEDARNASVSANKELSRASQSLSSQKNELDRRKRNQYHPSDIELMNGAIERLEATILPLEQEAAEKQAIVKELNQQLEDLEELMAQS